MPILKKILIVDDNKINRQVLCKILESTYDVLQAENGKVALEILYENYESISAVLLDIIMPVMNGYEMLEEISRDAFLSKIPIIVMTGTDDEGAEVKALSMGAHDFLIKPYKPAIILRRLANTIKLRETASLVNAVEKDELTGVYSKEFFYKKAEMILKENETLKYDIVCLDIERFKLVNDLFGMSAGDGLLRYIAERGQSAISGLGICGRIGADKFAFLIPHRDDYQPEMFAHAIEQINEFNLSISINACFGIYCIEDITVPISVMCDRALIAASSVKGKYEVHCAYYNDSFRKQLLSEQLIIDSMKKALVEEQFEIYYQPKYDLTTEIMAGAEALVRWNHPEKGFMSPDDFIPLFEKNGFITDLDLYVWQTVCKQLKQWKDNGYEPLPISVNVSRADIYNPEIADMLSNLVEKYDIDPKYLHLEITETAYTENPEQIISTVTKLRDLGFIIEMDDFGTGYSSLNMLSVLPIHVLKLDMKFIQSETAKENYKNILNFIISLAKWLNLQVVAEGVETAKQVQTLKSMDCNFAQGYYYVRPIPMADFEKLLGQQQKVVGAKSNRNQKQKTQRSHADRVMIIVDDSEISRNTLSEIFKGLYNIVEAVNGEDGYRYINEHYTAIDMILLDLEMPVMNGFEMLEKLKKNPLLKNIPVIITSQIGEDSETKALSLGAADFISKPYSTEVAMRRVSNVMAQSKLHIIEREQELAREVEEMRYMAEHDSLTGLQNRTALETRMNQFFASNQKSDSTFLMLDVDNFKSVNDTFGHDRGDELLVLIAEILFKSFRKQDTVARLGGDEFAVFVEGALPLADLKKRAKNLCQKLQMDLGGVQISVTIGIAHSPLYGSDYQTLYKHADSALLAAKRLGKNQYRIFDSEMEIPSPALFRNMDWLLDETSDAIVICDTKTYEILYLNNVAAEIAGKDKNTCIGQKCYETLWKNNCPCDHCISGDRLTKRYIEKEVEDSKNGRHYLVKDKLMEWNGKFARIQYIRDDTLQNNFKRKLVAANERYFNLFSALQAGIAKCLTDEAWTVVEANEKFYEFIGYSKEEFETNFKSSLAAVIEPTILKENRDQLAKQMQIGSKVIMDSCFMNKQGDLIYVSEQTVLVTESDQNSYYYATYIRKDDICSLQKGEK